MGELQYVRLEVEMEKRRRKVTIPVGLIDDLYCTVLTCTCEIIYILYYRTFCTTSSNDPQYPRTPSRTVMSSAVASLVKSAAQTAHAHVAALLAPTQVKPGDKLPLKETVKEADATKLITLAPSGKNIFVRTNMRFGSLCPCPAPTPFCFPSSLPLPQEILLRM